MAGKGRDLGDAWARKAKKMHPLTTLCILACLAFGFWLGMKAAQTITADDCFTLNGQGEYVVALGASVSYRDEGATAISFGQDLSGLVAVETDLVREADGSYRIPTDEPATYHMTYTVDHWRFANIRKVRTFVVGGGES